MPVLIGWSPEVRFAVGIPILLLIITTVPDVSVGAQDPKETPHEPSVWICGKEVSGDPWFEVRDDTLFYRGTHALHPPPCGVEPDTVPVETPDDWQRAARIGREAKEEARSAKRRRDLILSYTRVLDEYIGSGVESYEVRGTTILIQYEGCPGRFHQLIPQRCPVDKYYPKLYKPMQEKRKWFWRYYQVGSWLCWGCDYRLVIPPHIQATVARAMAGLDSLIAEGLSGRELRIAVDASGIGVRFQDERFLRDVLQARVHGGP
ncbi:MAG: hypothetical protein GF346_10035 [Candidatus Eisenbacteria bacterium]|nr:hypothetical protein [Candidatus Latescibacterota bacterium]MBD3302773.1 hypothetical protein [Candidatus Eisenbacteria bacterium]